MNQASRKSWLVPVLPAAVQPGISALRAVPLINVSCIMVFIIATLRGDTAPDRVYVVTGHYDSRCTDVLDFTSDAPGADDEKIVLAAQGCPTQAITVFDGDNQLV